MRALTPHERSAAHRNTAAVCRGEANARRLTQPAFAATLDTWAANQDRLANAVCADEEPDLFSTPSEEKAAA